MHGPRATRWGAAVLGAVSAITGAAPPVETRGAEPSSPRPIAEHRAASPTLAAPASAAETGWSARASIFRSRYYVIQTDLALDEARAYGAHLDQMYEEYERRLAGLPPRGPQRLEVFAFRTRDDYLRTLATRWGIDGRGSGGLFFMRGGAESPLRGEGAGSPLRGEWVESPLRGEWGLAFWTESLPRRRIHHVIQHEGFHQFAWSRFGNDLPIWLNEGLAEFFGGAVLIDDRLIVGESPARLVEHVRALVDEGRHVPFERLLAMTHDEWAAEVARGASSVHYHQAWSMVHFLVCGDEQRYREPFERYLRLVNNGLPSAKAFARVFGDDVEAFERRWKAYALGARPSAFVTALERIEYLAEGAIALTQKGRPPASLRELRDGLRGIGFTHDVSVHGLVVEIDAADDESFLIPAEGERAPAVFVVSAGRRRSPGRAGESLPAPPRLETKGLEPRELVVEWNRDEGQGLAYEITAR